MLASKRKDPAAGSPPVEGKKYNEKKNLEMKKER
jgi:hypothetical protein